MWISKGVSRRQYWSWRMSLYKEYQKALGSWMSSFGNSAFSGFFKSLMPVSFVFTLFFIHQYKNLLRLRKSHNPVVLMSSSQGYLFTKPLFFFCCVTQHVGSWFPDQGLPPVVETQSLNHWSTRQFPKALIKYVFSESSPTLLTHYVIYLSTYPSIFDLSFDP